MLAWEILLIDSRFGPITQRRELDLSVVIALYLTMAVVIALYLTETWLLSLC